MKSLALILFLGVLLMTSACNAWFIRNAVYSRIYVFDSNWKAIGSLGADSSHALDIPSFPIYISPCKDKPQNCNHYGFNPLPPYEISKPGCYTIWLDCGGPNCFYTDPLVCGDEEKNKEKNLAL